MFTDPAWIVVHTLFLAVVAWRLYRTKARWEFVAIAVAMAVVAFFVGLWVADR